MSPIALQVVCQDISKTLDIFIKLCPWTSGFTLSVMRMLFTSTSIELACSTIIRVSSLIVTSKSTAPLNQSRVGSTLSRSAYDRGATVGGSRMSVHGSGDPSSAKLLSTRPGPSVGRPPPESSTASQLVGRRRSRTTAATRNAARTSERRARPRTAVVKRVQQRHGRHRRLGLPAAPDVTAAVVVVVGIGSSMSSFSGPLISARRPPPSPLTAVAELSSTLVRSVMSGAVACLTDSCLTTRLIVK